ncbi:MAG: UvrD-helicase domain-containing protein [Caldisericia bacterium]|nr:UvrD-helicase domain-containing protein [Caldisericia bacterium]
MKQTAYPFLTELNPQQLEAVTHLNGPLAVYAGAGSGKTRVIIYRIVFLLEQGIPMDNILAVTFTNKAAGEMKTRISTLIQASKSLKWMGTFHSICLKILRMEAKHISLNSGFVVIDEEDSLSLIKDCMKEMNIDIKRINPKSIYNAISDAKIQMVQLEDYLKSAGQSYFTEIVYSIFSLYEKRKRETSCLDFDDLITQTIYLFEHHPAVLEKYQEIFQYILVDEYQDINYSQYRFLQLISGKYNNICVVGDDDQSIYSFRGASPDVMLKFTTDFPNPKMIKLEQNYRCSKTILSASNAIVKNNHKREKKVLWTDNENGNPLHLIICMNEKDEAQKIVRIIQEQKIQENRSYNDFVILYRVNVASRNFEEALIENGIPYQLIGGYRFYQRKEIKDFLAYIRIVFNPLDRISINRVINYPKRNIGSVFIRKIDEISVKNEINFLHACRHLIKNDKSSTRGKKGLEEFLSVIEYGIEHINSQKLSVLCENLLKKSDMITTLYQEYPDYIAKEKEANLLELITAIRRFELEHPAGTVQDFLSEVALFSDSDQFDAVSDKVTMMTVHSVKGLEFPIVFMSAMEEGLFPHYLSNTNAEALEEERRLCYVGMTRAKKDLYISYAMNREIYGKTSRTNSSRFISEIPEEMLEVVKGRANIHSENTVSEFFGTKLIPKTISHHAEIYEKEKQIPIDLDSIQTGDEIDHKIWGRGIVLSIESVNQDSVLRIHFDTVGERLLNLRFAPIKKI